MSTIVGDFTMRMRRRGEGEFVCDAPELLCCCKVLPWCRPPFFVSSAVARPDQAAPRNADSSAAATASASKHAPPLPSTVGSDVAQSVRFCETRDERGVPAVMLKGTNTRREMVATRPVETVPVTSTNSVGSHDPTTDATAPRISAARPGVVSGRGPAPVTCTLHFHVKPSSGHGDIAAAAAAATAATRASCTV